MSECEHYMVVVHIHSRITPVGPIHMSKITSKKTQLKYKPPQSHKSVEINVNRIKE
jgi:hypothetical protein